MTSKPHEEDDTVSKESGKADMDAEETQAYNHRERDGKPEVWVVCRDGETQWTFVDALGNTRSGLDILSEGKNPHVSTRISDTMVAIQRAIGYELLRTVRVNLSTDWKTK